VNQLGGPNKWLGLIFLFTAAAAILIQLTFLVLYVVRIANFTGSIAEYYDPDRLSW